MCRVLGCDRSRSAPTRPGAAAQQPPASPGRFGDRSAATPARLARGAHCARSRCGSDLVDQRRDRRTSSLRERRECVRRPFSSRCRPDRERERRDLYRRDQLRRQRRPRGACRGADTREPTCPPHVGARRAAPRRVDRRRRSCALGRARARQPFRSGRNGEQDRRRRARRRSRHSDRDRPGGSGPAPRCRPFSQAHCAARASRRPRPSRRSSSGCVTASV